MKIEEIRKDCTGCSACMSVCPQQCIIMELDEEGFYKPHIQKENCIPCGMCDEVCPVFEVKFQKYSQKAFSCQALDREKLLKATSGGVFGLLADEMFKCDGLVFGAVYDDNMKVIHSCAKDASDIDKMNGSKYVQSDVGQTFAEVRKLLEEGKKVLYSGVPCQIAGLLNTVGNHSNLVTIDVPCYGVPNSKLFSQFINYLGDKYDGKVIDFKFRDKHKYGFSHTTVITVMKKDGSIETITEKDYRKIPYHYAFGKRDCFAEHCYDCKYTQSQRVSDITLGSFWGVNKISSSYDITKGVSMVLCNSQKGEQLFSKIKDKLILEEHPLEVALAANEALRKSVTMPAYRNALYEDMQKKPFVYLADKYWAYRPIKLAFANVGKFAKKVIVKTKRTLKLS